MAHDDRNSTTADSKLDGNAVTAEPARQQSFQSKRFLQLSWNVTAIFLALLLMAIGAILLWGLNRGFDCQDEAYAVLLAQNPDRYPVASEFAYITHKLPKLLTNEICNFRLFHLIASILGASILATGFWRFYSKFFSPSTRLIPFSMVMLTAIGNLLGFSTIENSISYNTITAFLLCSATGFVLHGLSSPSKADKLLLVAAGLCTGIEFFVKFSSAIPFAFIVLGLIFCSRKMQSFRSIALYLVGVTAGILLFFSVFQSFDSWKNSFIPVLKMSNTKGHDLPTILWVSASSCLKHGKEIIAAGLTMLAASIAIMRLKSDIARTRIAIACGASGIIAFVIIEIFEYIHRGAIHSSVVYLAPSLVLFAAGCLASSCPKQSIEYLKNSNSQLLVCVLISLLVLPLVFSLGTNSPVLWHLVAHFGPVLLATEGIALIVFNHLRFPAGACLSIVLAAALCFAQFINGYLLHPKNIANLTLQTETTTLPALSGILVEPKLKAFFEESNNILVRNGYQVGDPLLAIYDSPGLVFAVGAESPGYIWYTPEMPLQNLHYLQKMRERHYGRFFLVVCNSEGSTYLLPEMIQAMRQGGIDYSELKLIGQSFHPYVFWSAGQQQYFYARLQKSP